MYLLDTNTSNIYDKYWTFLLFLEQLPRSYQIHPLQA